ncbi:hypothetical protein QQP08_000470 [Theobroma cacao]|nr:hypothetical protein QQP08_000470 [Theobroma cacao]
MQLVTPFTSRKSMFFWRFIWMCIMESSSSQGIDSDESVRCLQVENFDEQELVDHDLSDNIELCMGEVDKIIEESTESLPLLSNAVEPYIGMEFKSRDAAREFYEHNHSLMSPGKVPWRGSAKNLISEDEKDQRIRELTQELNNEKQKCKRRCAAYQEQLRTILKFVEEHTDQLSKRVQDIVENIRELEDAQLEDSDCSYV